MALILKNIMEDIVATKLDMMLKSLDCCTCEICRLDIESLALNRLPPKYIATTKGELLSKIDSLDSSFNTSVVTAIANAAQIVKKRPRHEKP